MQFMFVALFVAMLVVAVMFHEFGHYATAKAFGMKVDRFFFGFGPTLWSTQRGETEYGVKAIPAGGFVRIIGMSSFEEVDEADRGRTFYEQPAWQRLIVLAAGSATHFVFAAVLLFAGLWLSGVPQPITCEPSNTACTVLEDGRAAAAGITEGDVIVAVDGEPTGSFEEVAAAISANPGQEVPVTVERGGEAIDLTVTPEEVEGEGRIGIVGERIETISLGFGEAAAGTVSGDFSLGRLTVLTVQGLADVFSPQGLARFFGQVGSEEPREVDGIISVVGIGQVISSFGSEGNLFAVLAVFANLNIVLGLLNMAPLPPLDGGHVATLAVEESVNRARKLRGKQPNWRLDPAVITPIALLVIVGLTGLMLTALYLDIVDPITESLQ